MKRTSKADKLRRLLASGRWVHMRFLAQVAGWRYGARLHDLRHAQPPMDHEAKRDKTGAWLYRRANG
jgi:hypothetical protein